MHKSHSIALTAIAAAFLTAGAAISAPIHDAASKGDLATVKKLVKATPTLVSAKDKNGATPLHYAIAAGRKPVAEFLLTSKAAVEAKKNDGVRPLHVAAAMGKLDMVELLVSKKADINAADSTGRTPLTIARQKGNDKIIAFLLEHEAIDPFTMPSIAAAQPQAPVTPRPAPVTPPAQPKADLTKLSTGLIQALLDGRYSELTARFDSNMKSAMTEAKLAELRSGLSAQLGAFQSIGSARTAREDGYDTVYVKCTFANATVDVKFVYNEKQQLAGFFVM